jgi:WD40 repeat protein
LRYAPKGTLLAVAIQRGGIQLWDTQTQHPVRILSRDGNSHQISFGPDGRWLAAGVWGVNKPTDVQVWDVATGSEVTRLKGHKDMVWGAAFSPDGTYLVTGDASGNVILWKVEDWKDCTQLKTSGVYQIAISPDGQWLAAGGGTSEVAVWDLKSLLRSCR